MNASLAVKKCRYYAVLNYKDKNGKWRKKWVALGLPVRDNRRRAEAMLPALMDKYRHLEQLEMPVNATFEEYALEWLERRKTQVETSTFERYNGQSRTHFMRFHDLRHPYVKYMTKNNYDNLMKFFAYVEPIIRTSVKGTQSQSGYREKHKYALLASLQAIS